MTTYHPTTYTFNGMTITGGDPFLRVVDRNASATVTLLMPPLNPIGPNGSKRRGRNASNRYFAALLVRQGGAK